MVLQIDWPEEVSIMGSEEDVMTATSEAIQEIKNEMIATTPVVTGFLRASWAEGINDPPTEGDGISGVEANLTIGDVYYLVNTAVYAARVEYGFFGRDSLGRNYSQQGRGWVRAAAMKWEEYFSEALSKVGGD